MQGVVGQAAAHEKERPMKKTSDFPPGWDEERVQEVLRHYDSLSEDEEVAEDEAYFTTGDECRSGRKVIRWTPEQG